MFPIQGEDAGLLDRREQACWLASMVGVVTMTVADGGGDRRERHEADGRDR